MPKTKYIIRHGDAFGRLTVLSPGPDLIKKNGQHATQWWCLCVCGARTLAIGCQLGSGQKRSCGCLKAVRLTHGESHDGPYRSSEYKSWQAMIFRCVNPNSKDYPRWGGAGITVCERWLRSYENFLADMGRKPSPSHTIDRWPDQKGNYDPGNCRWATMLEQQRNRSSNRLITHEGITLCASEWAALRGVDRHLIICRIDRGWPVDLAINAPPRTYYHPCGYTTEVRARKSAQIRPPR